jgi:predicted  nucleic acid-binding Zn-ribbon protein
MNPDLEKLIRLQRTENDIHAVESSLEEIPRQKASLDAELAEASQRLAEAREALATSQKNRRRQEGDLQDLENRRSKYKSQLMEVKTNKEYSAMLHEIEAVEREIRVLEDKILAELEEADELAAKLSNAERHLRATEERVHAACEGLDAEAAALERKREALVLERDTIAGALTEDLLSLFQRVARLRGGVAVALAREESCQVCHMRLRPQMFMDVKRNDAIHQCPSCSRILYFVPPIPVVVPEP